MFPPTPTPAPSPSPSLIDLTGKPGCYNEKNAPVCTWIYNEWHIKWLAALSSWGGLARIASIVAIAIAALLLRWLVHRAIARLTESGSDVKVPAILRPLKEKAPEAFIEAAAVLSERRAQRARTIGSILKSIASATILVVAVMMILDKVNINLAPLIASAGIVGVAIGFGAQNLVKDFLSGVFMMLEDQYGVGDVVDLGEASGTVESVGLRITTLRDAHGVVWYIRNGEVVRVGNKSQGWAVVNVDVPVPFGTDIERAQQVMQGAGDALTADDEWKHDLLAAPEALGVEQITATGLTLRVTVRTTSAAQWRVARELRARVTEALAAADVPSGAIPPAPATAGPAGNGGTGVAGPT